MKRTFDILFTLATAPLWLPALVAVAAFDLAFMGRPVVFRDLRAGLGGRPFTLYKFRTMREGDGDDAGRLTGFGRFLRSTSLDELPQLFNVLRGDMSLVGPRPLPVRYLPRYSAEQARRHEVRPGITGLAQVSGRNAISWEKKLEYDVRYVDGRSFALDMKILALTILKVVARRGVNQSAGTTMEEFAPPGQPTRTRGSSAA